MRILPRPRREAMFEIYAFCRAVDDIADADGPRPARCQALAEWRCAIDSLYQGIAPPHRPLSGLTAAIKTFDLRREDFHSVIDGMEMDVAVDIQAPSLAMLDLYCDRVASAVGRLSTRAFGMPDDEGLSLAHHLGRALQLTNILRDLDEDAAINRLYLPREDLEAAGITAIEPGAVLRDPAVAVACASVIARAKAHFAEADRIMAATPRQTVRAPRIMADVYRFMLDCLERRGFAPPRSPIRTPRFRILLAILRYGLP